MKAIDGFSLDNSSLKFEHQECNLGSEFSGIDSSGRRVMGLVKSGALATTLLTENDFLWDIPDKWSLEDAVTVPVI